MRGPAEDVPQSNFQATETVNARESDGAFKLCMGGAHPAALKIGVAEPTECIRLCFDRACSLRPLKRQGVLVQTCRCLATRKEQIAAKVMETRQHLR